jgi:cytoskeletal protein CcmA (bactofilin family)
MFAAIRRMFSGSKEEVVATSVLAEGTEAKGNLVFNGHCRILGRVEGSIVSHGMLILEPQGTIVGEVIGDTVFIFGEVKGPVTARTGLKISKVGVVTGDVRAPVIVLEQGAHVDGKVEMPRESGVRVIDGPIA